MKAKIVFLTSVTCAILLATQIAKPPKAIPKPLSIQPVISGISECLISDFLAMDKGQADKEIPHRTVTPPQKVEMPKTSVAPEGIAKTGTQAEPFCEPPAKEIVPPQSSQSTAPQMGDTRVVNGQKQCYFLGFGWIDDNDEPNECIYAEDMYENGNKVGTMGTSDGDINKIVGTMD